MSFADDVYKDVTSRSTIVRISLNFISELEERYGGRICVDQIDSVIDDIDNNQSVYDSLMEKAFKKEGIKTPDEVKGQLHMSTLVLWETCYNAAILAMFNKSVLEGIDHL